LFGPDRASLRGKTTRRRPDRVRPDLVTITPALCDVCERFAVFVTQSRDIKLKTIEFLPSRTAKQLLSSLGSVA
ncbi:hypothetical protein ACHAXN_000737, partial [Cyclotella atomus]